MKPKPENRTVTLVWTRSEIALAKAALKLMQLAAEGTGRPGLAERSKRLREKLLEQS